MTARTMDFAAVAWTHHKRALPTVAIARILRSRGADIALVGLVAIAAVVSMTSALFNPAASDLIATISGL